MKKAIERFSLAQMTSNESGKTSASGTTGVLICFIGVLCFALGCVDMVFMSGSSEIINQSIVVIGIGTALLGYRKSQKDSSAPIDATNVSGCPSGCTCEKCAPKAEALNS